MNIKFEEMLNDLKNHISMEISSSFDKIQALVDKKISNAQVSFNQKINEVEKKLVMQENDISYLKDQLNTL